MIGADVPLGSCATGRTAATSEVLKGGRIKTDALSRSERLVKYSQMVRYARTAQSSQCLSSNSIPEFEWFPVKDGIDFISVIPDSILRIKLVAAAMESAKGMAIPSFARSVGHGAA